VRLPVGGEHDGDRIADGDVGDAAEFVDDDYFELRGAVDFGDDAVELVIGSLGNVVVQFDFLGKETSLKRQEQDRLRRIGR